MNKLINELQRLYFLRDPRCPGQAADDDCLAGETATALNMIITDGVQSITGQPSFRAL